MGTKNSVKSGKGWKSGKKVSLWQELYIATLTVLAFLTLGFVLFSVKALHDIQLQRSIYRVLASDISIVFFRSAALAAFTFSLLVLLILSVLRTRRIMRSHERFDRFIRSVISGINTGLLAIDSEGIVRYINSSCRRLLLCDGECEIEGLSYTELVDPLLLPIAEKLSAAIEAGESFSREYRVFLPTGVRCIQCDFTSHFDESFGQINVVSIEDKTKEDDTRQKLSQQLEETHRYAASRDNFFANMSHEIRTPINAILGMTYFAKRASPNPDCLGYIKKIENASELLLRVVNDILDFSKMQENKFSLNPEDFNLWDLRKIMYDLFALKAEQKGLVLSVQFDCPENFLVHGDQFRLTQIFMNLMSNAIKFTERGYVSVSLNHEILGKDVILRCSVRDTGCGLDEDDMSKLFTDFEQFGQVLVKNHEGTGLGLAITKRLVELMHGVIWVDSAPGRGSAFHFVVVIRKSSVDGEGDQGEGGLRISRKTGRVLVVEDNEINREIAETLLSEIGCEVSHASDGLEAIELCRTKEGDFFDLILMDIHMPRMNGYDAAKILKQELHVLSPIIAVTASTESREVVEANRDYIGGYLEKPYNPGAFRVMFADFPK
jgi:signal transduction histidine kinase/CheY-like chemotaxis protein